MSNEPPTMLDFGFGYQRTPASLSLSIQNQRHHYVQCTVTFTILTANGEWKLPPPYTGTEADQFVLKPGEAFHGSAPVQELVDSLPQNRRSVLITAKGMWKDETGEEGTAGPKSWTVDLENQSMRRRYSASEISAETLRIQQGPP